MFKKIKNLKDLVFKFFILILLIIFSISLRTDYLATPSLFKDKKAVKVLVEKLRELSALKNLLQPIFPEIISVSTDGQPLNFNSFFAKLSISDLDEIRGLLIVTAEQGVLNSSLGDMEDFSRHMLGVTSRIKAGPENLLKKCFLLNKEIGDLIKEITELKKDPLKLKILQAKEIILDGKKQELARAKTELDTRISGIVQERAQLVLAKFQSRLLSPEALLNYIKQDCFHKVDVNNLLEGNIKWLRNNLISGLLVGLYSKEWINENFFFDYNTGWFIPKFELKAIVLKTHRQIHKVGSIDILSFFDILRPCEGYDVLGVFVKDRMTNNRGERPFIIGITGGSSSGKSTFSEYFENRNSNLKVLILHLDDFYKSGLERVVFDTMYGIEALKFEEMRQLYLDIQNKRPIKIKQGQAVVIVNPRDYDIIFVEGIFPFAFSELPDIFDFKMSIWQDDKLRLMSRILRNRAGGAAGAIQNVKRFFQNKYQEQDIFMVPELEGSDIILDATRGIILSKTSEAELKHAA